jgi:hypothetical protein
MLYPKAGFICVCPLQQQALDARLRGHDGKTLSGRVIPAKAGIQFLVNPFAMCSKPSQSELRFFAALRMTGLRSCRTKCTTVRWSALALRLRQMGLRCRTQLWHRKQLARDRGHLSVLTGAAN